jgi:hypothetical protein
VVILFINVTFASLFTLLFLLRQSLRNLKMITKSFELVTCYCLTKLKEEIVPQKTPKRFETNLIRFIKGFNFL